MKSRRWYSRQWSESRFRTLIDKVSDGIVVVDRKGRIQYHTPSTERIFGRSADELIGSRLDLLLSESDALRLLAILSSEAAATTRVEWRVQHTCGAWIDLEVTADDLRGVTEFDGIIFTMRDVTERKRMDVEFRRQTLHDPLTRLPNRTHFAVRVDQALKGAKRRDGSIAVLVINLDDFKMVNDSLGHAAGDALLIGVAARLSTVARSEDTVARLGGDEFGLLLENVDPDFGGESAAQRIRAALQAPFRVNDKEIPVRACIGIAVGSPWKHTSDDVQRDAALAMSYAKQEGKDRIALFSPAMHQDATRRLEVAADLLGGIERNELVVFYQPIVDVRSREVLGAEALVRWRHPRLGLLGPLEFIPVAELTGLIVPIDQWVLNEVCRQAKAWKDERLVEEAFYVSVNLSARHLQDPTVVRSVKDALEASGLEAEGLVVEVTKSELIKDLGSAGASLAILNRLGVRVAVDNFGTGYSSLAHLARFPIHFVKIDRTFVETVNSHEGEMMVRAVVELAHTLGLTAIAEGVEYPEQALAIADVGCPMAQGNLFSVPLPADEIAPLLVRHFVGSVRG